MGYFTQLAEIDFQFQLSQQPFAGPGRPQAPPPQQPPIGEGDGLEERGTEAEKTENFCASLVPWQEGHSGLAGPITSVSKAALQSEQTYSKIGINRWCRSAVDSCQLAWHTHYK